MAKTYRPYVPEQDLLLPPSLREWLPEGHLAYFVSDLIDQLDLSGITKGYEDDERGYPPYHPVMLTKVLVYAYCAGVFSSRTIQRRLLEDVPFRVLATGNEPDFRTIADFRKTHLAALNGFFEQVLRLARALGAPRMGRVALDGSKVKANASKHKAMSYDRLRTSLSTTGIVSSGNSSSAWAWGRTRIIGRTKQFGERSHASRSRAARCWRVSPARLRCRTAWWSARWAPWWRWQSWFWLSAALRSGRQRSTRDERTLL